jgi:amino acid transporter
VFAISFAFISVTVGVFGTYDDVLRTAGPVGIWLWVIAAVGQTVVALAIAQFAARIALTGSISVALKYVGLEHKIDAYNLAGLRRTQPAELAPTMT